MTDYLLIENEGVCSSELFTLMGASTKRSGSSQQVIGKFGSGNKHGVAVCLRHDLKPVIFCGSLKLEFLTREQPLTDGHEAHNFARVCVKYGGKDIDGTNRSATEDLGYVLEYGATDWLGVDLACREFVSNAIDREVLEGEHRFESKYREALAITKGEFDSDTYETALAEYRAVARDFQNVTIKIVSENQVRAKAGYTRIFIPVNEAVRDFHANLGKWFLHFSEPENINKAILPKADRNLGKTRRAVIYRRGVRVREFEASNMPSVFDYNLNNLQLDESRKVDDSNVRHHCAMALADGTQEELETVLAMIYVGEEFWEHKFEHWSLTSRDYLNKEQRIARWTKAYENVFHNKVLAAKGSREVEIAQRKGFEVIELPHEFACAAIQYGARSAASVISQDDLLGQEITEATPDAICAVDYVWELIVRCGMTDGKDKPPVMGFRKIMDGECKTHGFYRDGITYINDDIAGVASVAGGIDALSDKLIAVALEECAHYITNALDNSRDFQDWAFNFAAKAARLEK